MKRNFRKLPLLALLVVLLFVGSCAKSEPMVVYSLTLSQRSVVFGAEGGERLLAVVPFPEEEEWNLLVDEQPEWVTMTASDEGVIVVAEANTAPEVREASFSLVSPKGNFEPYEVTIAQEAAALLSWSTSAAESYQFDSEGGERAFVVVANAEWRVESDSQWLEVEYSREEGRVVLRAARNESEELLRARLTITVGEGVQQESREIVVEQDIRANNPYYKLVGQWEITAAKWFYSPNGSLNSLDYNPNPNDYYLVFDMVEGEYGKTLLMQNFLYPGTEMEVRYDSTTGGIVIPFGWTVLSYDVFFYVTLVSDRQFSYASYEVSSTLSEDGTSLRLDMPTVSGFNYVGFGLWTYNDSGDKIAVGSNYRPTMFPMSPIVFKKQTTN